MSNVSRYWTLLRLNPAGQVKAVTLTDADRFFQQHFPNVVEQDNLADATIQLQLFTLWRSTDATTIAIAELCLRCFLSHQIVQACTSLQTQFGNHYGFTLQDLLPYVLNDDGRVPANPQCLAIQVLQSFRPELSSLATWTARAVRQDHGLNRVLVEHGLYLVSDWAILNDTKPEQLPVILTNFYGFSAVEVKQNCVLLESYRLVYLPDRLKQRGRRCAEPTPDQLERMSGCIQAKTATFTSPAALLVQLQRLAKRLRQYRIYRRGGPLPAESIDTPAGAAKAEQLEASVTDALDDRQQRSVFLQRYRQLFLDSLDEALQQVVSDRQRKSKKPEQARQFTTALHLFYCQQVSMTAIAQQIGLRGQDSVTRLLKLKDFRADVRRHMLQHLQSHVLEQAKAYCDPDRLQQLDDQVEAVLNEQLEALMEGEAKRSQTAKTCLVASLFSQQLCQYLDRTKPQPRSQSTPQP
jgi:hypothetical protein